MRGPNLVLPSSAMPWGRWAQDSEADTSRRISSMSQDANSVGSQFRSRADLLERQISGVSNVSTQQSIELPSYTRSHGAGGFDDPNFIFESPVVSFVPPRPIGSYRVVIMAEVNATQTSGLPGAALNYASLYLMVDGRVYRQSQLEENLPPDGTFTQTSKISSIFAWASADNGQATTVSVGLSSVPFAAQTVRFDRTRITAVYVGGL